MKDKLLKNIFWFALGSFIALLLCINEVYADTLGTPTSITFKTTGEQVLTSCTNADYCYGYNFSNPNPNNYAQVRYDYNFHANQTYYISYQAYFGFAYGNRYLNQLPANFTGSISAGVYGTNSGQYITCSPTIEYYSARYGNIYWDNTYVGNSTYMTIKYECSINISQESTFLALSVIPSPTDPTSAMFVRESNLVITTNEAEFIVNNDNKNHKETMEGLYEIRDSITDTTIPDVSNFGQDYAGYLPAGPLDSIVNMPKTLLIGLLDDFNQTCSPIDLTLPFVDRNITIPCLNTLYRKIPALNLFTQTIGLIAMVLIIFRYSYFLSNVKDGLLTMSFDDLELLSNPYSIRRRV